MIGYIWNCRGLGHASTIRHLKAQIREYNPNFISLSETKICLEKTKKILLNLGFQNFDIQGSKGLSGGICLSWRKGVELEVVLSNQSLISAVISSDPLETRWLLSSIYALANKRLQPAL